MLLLNVLVAEISRGQLKLPLNFMGMHMTAATSFCRLSFICCHFDSSLCIDSIGAAECLCCNDVHAHMHSCWTDCYQI